MLKVLLSLCLVSIGGVVSFYSLSVQSNNGSEIHFKNFRNRKILLVNTATNSEYVNQLQELQQLSVMLGDTLMIVACPSNSFGNEPLNDSALNQVMRNSYHLTFPISVKSPVLGDSSNNIYKWTARKDWNDVSNTVVKGDYYKYLINGSGKLVGIFDCSVSPLSEEILRAIRSNR
jgi:glutathione peroxidase